MTKKVTKAIFTLLVLVLCSPGGMSQSLPGDSIVFGPMFSPVYNDTVRVWVLTKDNTGSGDTLDLKVTSSSAPNAALSGTVFNTDSRLGYHLRSYVYGGLSQGDTYNAVVQENGVNSNRSSSLKNQSIGYNDFSFLAGGCARIYDTTRCIDRPEAFSGAHINGTTEIFNQMATEDSDMMVWLGDAVYLLGLQHANGQCPNGVDDWANKDMAFDRYMFYRQFHDSLTRAMPQLAITDNHDTGPNEFDKTMSTLGDMKEIFMDWWPNPTYNSTQEAQGLFSSYVYNDVEFFLTDNRSYRTSTTQHFGADQQNWLKQALLNSKATFKVIISGTPVFNPKGGRNYSVTTQGEELKQFIEDNNIDGVLAYDADIHSQEFYGNYQAEYPLFDALSGNLASDVGNNPFYNINLNDNALMSGRKQTYVKSTVQGDSSDRRINIQYMDEFGSPYFGVIIHSDMLVSEQDSVKKLALAFSNGFTDSAESRAITNTGVSFGEDKDGNQNSAAVFSAGSSLTTSHTTNINMHDRAFSLMYWVKPSSFGTQGSVVMSKGTANDGFSIGFDKDGHPQYVDHATGSKYTSTITMIEDRWAHLTWMYDNVKRQIKLYFNGQEVQLITGVTGSVASSADLMIGSNYAGNHFTGSLDDVELYGKLISVDYVRAIAGSESSSGTALELDGSQNMHIPGSVVNPVFADDFTVEFWSRLFGDPCTNCKLMASNGRVNGNTTGFSFEFSSDNKINMVFGNNTSGWNANSNLGDSWNIGEWNHVVLSFTENDSARVYINGVMVGAQAVTSYAPNSWGLGLGDSPAYGSEVTGELDQLRIWDVALPRDSIVKRMHYSLNGNESGLQLNYDFEANTDTTFISNGAVAHEVELDGGSFIASTAPIANISADYRKEVVGNWSVASNNNGGLYFLDVIGSYVTNLVVGRNEDTTFAVLDSASNKFYAKAGWQLEQSNLPFANIRLNLAEALHKHDSITNLAGSFYLVREDSVGYFSIVSNANFDGVNVNFKNTYIEGGHYFLAWTADSTGVTNRGGSLSLNAGHDVKIPYQAVDSIFASPFTIETWFRINQSASGKKLISTHGRVSGNSTGLSLEFASNNTMNVVFGTNGGGWNAASANTTFNVDEWNHIAVTVTPNDSFRIYVNGALTNTKAFNTYIVNNNWDLALGKSINYGGDVLAEMDEVRIWSKAKTGDEIKDQMHLSMDGLQNDLRFNLTFDQEDFGYIINQVAAIDSFAFSNANLVNASAAVSNIDLAYQNKVRGSWSVDANGDNGLFVSSSISNFESNLVVGKSQDDQINILGGSADTVYLAGGWLLNPMNLDTADLTVDLTQVFDDADSISALAKTFYLVYGDPLSSYEFVSVGVDTNNVVLFTDVNVDYGVYYLAWQIDTTLLPDTKGFPILTSNDDAEQDVNNGTTNLTSSDLEVTLDGSSEQLIGLRFDNITIPQGSVIHNAYIQFNVDEVTTSGNVDAAIAIEDAVDPLEMNYFAYNISSRTPYYGDTLVWNVPAFNAVNDNDTAQRTPDLSALLSNSINKQDWESGNAVLFMLADPAEVGIAGYTGNTGKRTASSYDSDPAKAPKLVVSYTKPERYYNGSFPIAKGSSWLYDTTAQSLDTVSWKSVSYNDSAWAYGDAILGYGDGNETTTLDFGPDANNKYPTYYLRHKFDVEDASLYDSLVFKVLRDDGVVVYVNGVEAFRQNMPQGAVTYNTYASTAVSGADETTYFETVTAKMLQNGTNVIAVELHQQSANSSDLSFDMEVGFTEPALAPASYPLASGEVWHYLDNNSTLDTVAWTDTIYNDYNWNKGEAPLGYGDPVTTTLSYGSDGNNKHITTYLRRDVMIDTNDAAMGDTVMFGLRRDDGAVVYLNGTELIRSNMPSGTVTNQTLASTAVAGSDETDFFTYKFPKSIFVQGRNQIAVELHQVNASSSDLVFDLYIKNAPVVNPPALGCANGNGEHIACFTSIAPTSQTSNMLIPSGTHKFQMLMKQGEAYTVGGGNVPGLADYTGYLGLNGSSEQGHLAVNHETTPGGVSMVDLHYNDTSRLWVVDTTQAVDFYNTDLVTTSRNCSGGITPWGTMITAEESTSGGDVNSDGYQDVGWFVEVDPITSKVVDYDNDGVQDKLWAMGRMNHENVVVSDDSTTAYYGEDGGTHCVYKYVMTTPGDLSSGSVYVLSLSQPLVNNEPTSTTASWIQVPNSSQSDRNNLSTLAASLGGTNFNGVEDVEISPLDGKIYFASKGKGRVYRFDDNGSSVSNFETFVGGTSYVLNTEQGVFTEAWGGGNDNLVFDDQGNLWVQQDGGRNYIWVVRPDHSQTTPKVELFASMPAGAEPTGLTFTPDYRFGFFSVQHPSGSNTSQVDAAGNTITFNASSTIVFSREKWLGAQKPIAGFEADTTVITLGNNITYSDTSLNSPTSWNWTFNGGSPATSTNSSETVTYNGLGFYTTQLVATNSEGSDTAVYTQYIEVIEPAPVADFVASKTQLIAGDSVSFTDLSTNNPDSLYWSFAGGSSVLSTDSAPVITYNTPGLYDVVLTAYNRAGASVSNTKVDYIEVMAPAPVADFAASATQIMVGDSVTFTDLSTNDPDTWNWIFSGGAPSVSTDSMPTITYNTPGMYDVTLITTNATGSSAPNVKVAYIEVVDNTSLEENILAELVDLYPNPTSGQVTLVLDLSGGEDVVVELYDLRARKLANLAHTTSSGGKQKWIFNLDNYVDESQALIIKIQVDQEVITKVVQLMN